MAGKKIRREVKGRYFWIPSPCLGEWKKKRRDSLFVRSCSENPSSLKKKKGEREGRKEEGLILLGATQRKMEKRKGGKERLCRGRRGGKKREDADTPQGKGRKRKSPP